MSSAPNSATRCLGHSCLRGAARGRTAGAASAYAARTSLGAAGTSVGTAWTACRRHGPDRCYPVLLAQGPGQVPYSSLHPVAGPVGSCHLDFIGVRQTISRETEGPSPARTAPHPAPGRSPGPRVPSTRPWHLVPRVSHRSRGWLQGPGLLKRGTKVSLERPPRLSKSNRPLLPTKPTSGPGDTSLPRLPPGPAALARAVGFPKRL